MDRGGREDLRRPPPVFGRDVLGIFGEATRAGAAAVVTTEKDYVRLLPSPSVPAAGRLGAAYNGA